MNPFFDLIADSAWMATEAFERNQDPKRSRDFNGEYRAATYHAIAAIRCFANNALECRGAAPSAAPIVDRIAAVIALWDGEPLTDEETAMLQELDLIAQILEEPRIAQAYDANCPLNSNTIDFERTPVYRIAKHCESWSVGHAILCLGLTITFVNNLVIDRLHFTEIEITKVFGYTIRSQEGFQDILDPLRYRKAAKALEAFRTSPYTKILVDGHGFALEDFALKFLPN